LYEHNDRWPGHRRHRYAVVQSIGGLQSFSAKPVDHNGDIDLGQRRRNHHRDAGCDRQHDRTRETVWTPYLKSDVWWRTADADDVAFGTNVLSTLAYTGPAVEVGAGVSGRITPLVSVYGEASYRTAVDDAAVDDAMMTSALNFSFFM
jgi:outer membrane autotransporter protein